MKFTNDNALFSTVLTDFRQMILIKTWKNVEGSSAQVSF